MDAAALENLHQALRQLFNSALDSLAEAAKAKGVEVLSSLFSWLVEHLPWLRPAAPQPAN